MDDDERGIVDEQEMLSMIFEKRFKAVGDDGGLTAFDCEVEPRVDDGEAVRVRATVRLTLPAEYPVTAPPSAAVLSSRGLSDADTRELLRAAASASDDNVGMNSCFTVFEAVADFLTSINQSSASCSVCLQLVKPEQTSYTAPCLHTFHQRCLSPWIRRCEERLAKSTAAALADGQLGRRLNAARGSCQNKAHLHSVAVVSAATLRSQLDEAKAALTATTEHDTADDAEIKAARALVARLTEKLASTDKRVEAAAAVAAQHRAALAEAEAHVQAEIAKRFPEVPCPDCRADIEFDDVKVFYRQWATRKGMAPLTAATVGCGAAGGAGAGAGSAPGTPVPAGADTGAASASTSPDPAASVPTSLAKLEKSKKLMAELPDDAKHYLAAFKARWAALNERQAKVGGIITA